MNCDFLATTKEEIFKKGKERPDFVFITGDAYVDHPSFGVALIGRILESFGYLVLIVAQPNVKTLEGFKDILKPRYGFLVSSGNIESMVNNYYVSKRRRNYDEYSEGGDVSKRPDRAFIKYCNIW